MLKIFENGFFIIKISFKSFIYLKAIKFWIDNTFKVELPLACNEREFTIKEMIGKKAVSIDDIHIGEIIKIIDQSDSSKDDPNKICDIEWTI